ncbi:thioredoxin domain-containing protein [Methanogenium sp. S4BF]|uniref:thioredoxin family protein n=1 Tax=Methanogenium sp. S4BF TaxID=1789226 RepID=UPI00241762CE|nr:thioredoxin domain-containing protein [Methanogenium sp. S4BF]WFN34863.1 thioredoxin domain-containing protein [Methanogenium sp. S4BF]
MAKPVLMDFFAVWCGPCKLQTPELEKLKEMMGDAVEIKKIDVDDNLDLAQKYGIMVVPTLIIEKDGQVKERLEGVTPADTLMRMLEPLTE